MIGALTKSEEKTLAYLKQMFPGYAWGKTAGGGQLDFMGAPPPEADLPMLFVESKCAGDRTRASQGEWAKSDIGMRCRKFVVYSPNDNEIGPCFLYTWDDFLTFVEREDVVARDHRKAAERRATREMPPGEYAIVDGKGVDAKMRIDDAGTCILLAGSKLRQEVAPSIPPGVANLRNDLQSTGKLVLRADGVLELTKDEEVSSTSFAACAVYGRSASGPFSWQKAP
jgi:hypothetical protein